eukprot:8591748-Lingulodinium_polyedra.AAC.1
MGFGAAAGWAQAAANVVCRRACLPEQRRVLPDGLLPAELPVWGSILDDLWAVQEDAELEEQSAPMAQTWMERVEEECGRAGLP